MTSTEPGASLRLTSPRVEPVDLDRYTTVVNEMGGRPPSKTPLNVTRLWARHPPLMKALRALQIYLLTSSTLPPRDREIAILRVGWLCCSAYELAQHAVFGFEAGLDEADFRRVTEGAEAAGWTPHEACLLRSVDEMITDAFITDATWQELAGRYSDEQMLDLMSVVGRYFTVCIILNSSGVQLEPDRIPFDRYVPRSDVPRSDVPRSDVPRSDVPRSDVPRNDPPAPSASEGAAT